MTNLLRDKVAVVGIGSSNFGEMYRARQESRTAEALGAAALAEALADAGLEKDELDGLAIMRIDSYQQFAAMIGMKPGQLGYINRFDRAGRFCAVTLQAAAMAIATGQATTVACVYGNNGRSAGDKYGGDGGYGGASFEAIYGMTSPGASVSHSYSRYASKYGVPDGALAPLAINNRKNAAANPLAVMREPLSEETYLASRYIAEPLRLYDYCLINDGGVAVIMTSTERARDQRKRPAVIRATTTSTDLSDVYQSQDEFFASATAAAARLWAGSDLSPADIDVAEIYDNFTPTILYSLEAFGYCPRGTAWEWIRDGRIELGGELPINTSGGHTSESYMQGWNHFAELVRQLRGEAVNQVSGCEVGQYICVSPINSSFLLYAG
jgi:acetyl-CoA acetyltransferase